MKKCLLVSSIILLAFVQQALAQTKFEAIPVANRSAPLLNSHFNNYRLYSIPTSAIADFARKSTGLQTTFELNLPGLETWKLELEEHNLLANDYTLVVNGPEGKKVLPKPAIKTYSGYLSDAANSRVRLTIDNDIVYGIIKKGDKEYYIEPVRYFEKQTSNDLFVVYEKKDVVIDPNLTCGATETEQRRNNTAQRLMAGTNCVRVRLAIASDASMFTRYGSATAVQTHNIGVMNNVMWDYVNGQFNDNIEFVIVTQNVSTIAGTDQLSPAYSGTDVDNVLGSFAGWGQAGNFGTTYDLGQFWTTRNLDDNGANSGIVGFAYFNAVGATCANSNLRYHILEDFGGSNTTGSGFGLRVLTSHEIGHNFNCAHDGSTTFIMSPSVSNTSTWSATSIATVNAFVPGRTCLSACNVAGVPVVNFTGAPDTAVCVGATLQLLDRSLQGPTSWNWTLTGGNPSSSTDRNPTVVYATAGLKTVTLNSSNGAGVGTPNTKAILVSNSPATACLNSGTSTSNAGIKYFGLNNIERSSGGASADANKYIDRSCSDITRLTTSTQYTVTVTIGDAGSANHINFYIDYNNDGDFADIDEMVYTSGSGAGIGTTTFTFTTPASVTANQFLRARIIAKDFTGITTPDNPCHDPSAGQVEDYAVYFASSISLPVTLLNFEGYHANGKNILNWKTADEKNNSHFEIETSKDGKNFYQVGRVEGKNIPSSVFDYSFTDNLPSTGINYYRLKQVDIDGKSAYSKIISVTVNEMQRPFVVYPNPARDNLTIDFAEPSPNTSIELFAADGKLVKKLIPGNIQRTASIDISSFNSGVYIIQVRSDKGMQQLKFIKQ